MYNIVKLIIFHWKITFPTQPFWGGVWVDTGLPQTNVSAVLFDSEIK